MALSLDGATQWVTIGAAVDVISARPFTLAALVRRTGTTTGIIFAQGNYGDWGWTCSILSSGLGDNLFFQLANDTGVFHETTFSGLTIPSGTGWQLVVLACVDAGSSTDLYAQAYRYDTAALTTTSENVAADYDAGPLLSAHVTGIGSYNAGTEPFPGDIGWVGIWGVDLTDGGQTGAGRVNELIHYGPDALNTTDCELLATFDGTATDESDNARTLTLTGSPGYATTGVTYRAGRALAVSGSAATPSLTGSVTAVSLTGTVDSVAVTGS